MVWRDPSGTRETLTDFFLMFPSRFGLITAMRAEHASRIACWVLVFAALSVWSVRAQTTSISDITGNPGRYQDQVVTVEGRVDRLIDSGSGNTGASRTKNYVLVGDQGSEIQAKTTQKPPSPGSRYRVKGLISISPFNRNPVIIEQSRTQLSSGQQRNQQDSSAELREGLFTTSAFLLTGLGLLVAALIGYFAYASQETVSPRPTRSSADRPAETDEEDEGEESSLASTEMRDEDTAVAADADSDVDLDSGFPDPSSQQIKSESSSSQTAGATEEKDDGGPETLKFKSPPKTMKFVPGRLVIAAGPDQGKEFRIAGRPTPDGNVVTIGRAEVQGEKAFAHIQLGDTYRTVSRMQAEIIQQDDTILLKNTSETNPTMVNGQQIPTGETMEIDDGDMIRMGELMLRYERD